MATGNTSLLGLALPVEGELDGTWGDVVNDSITSLVDSAVAGTTTLSTDADVTLTDTTLAANQSRQAILLWTASNGATTRNITAPARSKPYIVINAGTGSVVLRGAGPTTGVTVVAGEKCLAAWNGSDFVKVASSVADGVTSVGGTGTVNGITLTGTVTSTGDLTLGGALSGVSLTTQVTGTLPVANGGTGATSLTANNVILGNGTSAPLFVAPGTSGNVLTSNGTTWTSAASTAGDVTLNGTQTLTNKTISADSNTLSGIAASSFVLSNGSGNIDGSAAQKAIPSGVVVGTTDTQTLTNKTLTDPTITGAVLNDGYTEEVYAIPSSTTPALSPTNGSIQTWTLTGNSTPTAGTWAAGQSITLMVDDGTAYTITWTSLAVTWQTGGGTAPTLATTGYTAIALWKVGTTIYGAVVGG